MIIFANDELWNYFTLNPEKFYLMNFCSNYNIGESVKKLFPPPNIINVYVRNDYNNLIEAYMDTEEFKNSYLNYLCSYDAFLGILEIMMNDYYYDNVAIITDLKSNIVCTLIDLISQFIYDRYMYQPIVINDILDLSVMKQTSIPVERLGIFQSDKEYYVKHTVDPKKLLDEVDKLEVANSGTV